MLVVTRNYSRAMAGLMPRNFCLLRKPAVALSVQILRSLPASERVSRLLPLAGVAKTRHHHHGHGSGKGQRSAPNGSAKSSMSSSAIQQQISAENTGNFRDMQLHIETLIESLPLTRYLRSAGSETDEPDGRGGFRENRLHDSMHTLSLSTHLVGGSLSGRDKLLIDPYFFISSDQAQIISICHIGTHLCGHPGYVHGGLIFALFDDIFARCSGTVFRSGVAMTANMSIDFRKPSIPGRVYIIRAAASKVEGRKAWLTGSIRCLNPFTVEDMKKKNAFNGYGISMEEETADLVAEVNALFVEPKFANVHYLFPRSLGKWSG